MPRQARRRVVTDVWIDVVNHLLQLIVRAESPHTPRAKAAAERICGSASPAAVTSARDISAACGFRPPADSMPRPQSLLAPLGEPPHPRRACDWPLRPMAAPRPAQRTHPAPGKIDVEHHLLFGIRGPLQLVAEQARQFLGQMAVSASGPRYERRSARRPGWPPPASGLCCSSARPRRISSGQIPFAPAS